MRLPFFNDPLIGPLQAEGEDEGLRKASLGDVFSVVRKVNLRQSKDEADS